MKILILHNQRSFSTKKLEVRLPQFQFITEQHSEIEWDGKYTSIAWRNELLASAYKKHGEKVDAVLYIPNKWESTSSRLFGFAYRKLVSSYFFSVIKDRKNIEDTIEHELLHIADYSIWTYLGINLKDMFGVNNFATDIVHGEHPDYKEYEYGQVWKIVNPLLLQALIKRKNKAILSYQDELLIIIRETLLKIRDKISEMETLLHPLGSYKDYVTQGYGVRNPIYTLTGVHIGTDYACPVGTPVYAPWDGEVTVAGYSDVLGYFCHYQYTYQGQQYTDRYLHLKEKPRTGSYSRGNIVGRTGNSGLSTNPHCHIDIWTGDVDLTIINKKNWSTLTVDPEKHYETI